MKLGKQLPPDRISFKPHRPGEWHYFTGYKIKSGWNLEFRAQLRPAVAAVDLLAGRAGALGLELFLGRVVTSEPDEDLGLLTTWRWFCEASGTDSLTGPRHVAPAASWQHAVFYMEDQLDDIEAAGRVPPGVSR